MLSVGDSCSDGYDLDSTDSSWGEGKTFVFDEEFQAYCGSSILVSYEAEYKLIPKSSPAQFSTCQGTGYGGGGTTINYSDLSGGEKLCFKTSEGRLSLLTVKTVSDNSLAFKVITWEPTGQ